MDTRNVPTKTRIIGAMERLRKFKPNSPFMGAEIQRQQSTRAAKIDGDPHSSSDKLPVVRPTVMHKYSGGPMRAPREYYAGIGHGFQRQTNSRSLKDMLPMVHQAVLHKCGRILRRNTTM